MLRRRRGLSIGPGPGGRRGRGAALRPGPAPPDVHEREHHDLHDSGGVDRDGHRVFDGHERAAGPIPQLHPPALAGRGPRLPLQLWPAPHTLRDPIRRGPVGGGRLRKLLCDGQCDQAGDRPHAGAVAGFLHQLVPGVDGRRPALRRACLEGRSALRWLLDLAAQAVQSAGAGPAATQALRGAGRKHGAREAEALPQWPPQPAAPVSRAQDSRGCCAGAKGTSWTPTWQEGTAALGPGLSWAVAGWAVAGGQVQQKVLSLLFIKGVGWGLGWGWPLSLRGSSLA